MLTDTVGILGTGRMGVRLARMFARAGRSVILGSRTPTRAEAIARGLGVRGVEAGTYQEAADAAFVLPAAFIRDGLFGVLEDLRPQLDGKIIIDITNPFNADYSDFILPWNTSAAEELQKRFPKSAVVGAFKNVWWECFDDPEFDGGPSDVLVVSDEHAAKARFMRLVEGTPFRYVDAGRLSNARTVERMTLLSGELGQRLGYFPRMNWRLVGEPWAPGQRDDLAPLIARS